MKITQTLVGISLLNALEYVKADGEMHPQLSLYRPYLDSELGSASWEFGGDTIIDVESEIRLTPDAQSKIGWVYSKNTLPTQAYEVELEYKINGKGTFHGDGMALWLTKEKQRNGNAMGNGSKFKGLGVFIDTFPNADRSHNFPYISIMLNNGDKVYDHEGDNAATSSGGCEAFARDQEFPTKLRLSYVKGRFIDLHVTTGFDSWKLCARIENYDLPEDLYLGVTAATGQITDVHDVISMETRLITQQAYVDAHGSEKVQAEEPKLHNAGSFVGMLMKVGAFVAVVGIVGTAYRAKSSSYSAKHF